MSGRTDCGPRACVASAGNGPRRRALAGAVNPVERGAVPESWTAAGGGLMATADRDADMPDAPPVKRCVNCGRRFYCRMPRPVCLTCRLAPPAVRPAPVDPAIRNRSRRPLPAGTRRARERYRAAGLCVSCGAARDRPDRLACQTCRRRLADAQNRHRAAHPPDRDRLRADVRARRRRYLAAGLCPECGAERDRPDRRLCARCRDAATVKTRAYRARRRG